MSLSQTYRSQITARQNRQLWVFLSLAAVIHAAGAAGLIRWHPELLNRLTQSDDAPVPVDFVEVTPEVTPLRSPVSSQRFAQANSTGPDQQQPKQTVPAGKNSGADLGQPRSPVAPTPTTPVPIRTPVPPRATPAPVRTETLTPLPAPSAIAPSSVPTASLLPASPAAHPTATTQTLMSEQGAGSLDPERPAAGRGVDATQDALWGTYLSGLNQAIDQRWRRVAGAAVRRTKIQFRLDRQGQLTDLQLLQSSGDNQADQAALHAIQAAAPFAPLPQAASENVLIVNFTFTQGLVPSP